ncbi:3-hydroxyacyl-CoA dehydrogenase family protein [Aeromicrobium sp. UC242_57]|uniref:3-hydroxyacyl-CoA dehydrogenase family protein n=1 Tax=Aeromicrobium sp. UC242_57 TaxID=3374624 RepID=UPI0037A7C402
MSSAVIGAGSMGIGIAYVLAAAGQDVALVDQNESALDVATTSLAAIAQRSVDRGRIGPADAAALISRISRSTELDAVADVDLVIEAVFEDLDLKCRLLADVEAVVDGRAVLATNTSYLDVERMADGLKDPTRLIGMHFFNPVPAMRLVEVVRARRSDPVAVAAALGLVVRLGKQPVVAQAAEGFVGNRLFAASRRHAEYLIEDGATPAQVDAAARTFGFAMGPFATADLWG